MNHESFIFTKLGSTLTVMFAMSFIFFIYSVQGGTFINITLNQPSGGIIDLNKGLVGHWTFDGPDMDNGVEDRSGNGYTGTLIDFTSTTTTFGSIGQALEFDGNANRVQGFTSDPFEYTGGGMSISLWVKLNTTETDTGYLVSKPWNGNGNYNYRLSFNTSKTLSFYLKGATVHSITTTDILSANSWSYVTATVDSSKSMNIYINGLLIKSGTHTITDWTPPAGDDNVSLTIASLYPYGSGWPGNTAFSVDGSIDDVRIYNRALSADEITRLYKLGATTKVNITLKQPANGTVDLNTGLVGHWTFDGPDMLQNVADISGQGNHGALSGQTSTTTVIGKIGQALEFDGDDDYVEIEHDASISFDNTTDRTIMFWMNGNEGCVITKSVNYYCYYIGASTKYYFKMYDGGTTGSCSSDTVNDGKWHHLAFVVNRENDLASCYTDGVFTESDDISDVGDTSNSNSLRIGDGTNSGNFNGSIDDVRIYNRALSADEITRLYKLGATTKINKTLNQPSGGVVDLSTGLVGHWTFDGPDMLQNVADISGQGNDGSLFGQTSTSTVIGKIGQALEFDGSDDEIDFGNVLDIGLSDRTLSAWFKTSYAGDHQIIVGKGYSRTSTGAKIYLASSSGTLNAQFADNAGGNDVVAISADAYNDNEWHFATAVYDRDGDLTLYADGVQVDAEDLSGLSAIDSNNANSLQIGVLNAPTRTSFFNGSIDDVRIYNRALSADEVTRLYKLGGGR